VACVAAFLVHHGCHAVYLVAVEPCRDGPPGEPARVAVLVDEVGLRDLLTT
jgi:hypothetical protein